MKCHMLEEWAAAETVRYIEGCQMKCHMLEE